MTSWEDRYAYTNGPVEILVKDGVPVKGARVIAPRTESPPTGWNQYPEAVKRAAFKPGNTARKGKKKA